MTTKLQDWVRGGFLKQNLSLIRKCHQTPKMGATADVRWKSTSVSSFQARETEHFPRHYIRTHFLEGTRRDTLLLQNCGVRLTTGRFLNRTEPNEFWPEPNRKYCDPNRTVQEPNRTELILNRPEPNRTQFGTEPNRPEPKLSNNI